MIDKSKLLKYPYMNGYCDRCAYNDKNVDNLCCVKFNYANCGSVIECSSYTARKEKIKNE